jgi:hypothetical protein
VTGVVDQEVLARIEYLAAENRILKSHSIGRLPIVRMHVVKAYAQVRIGQWNFKSH